MPRSRTITRRTVSINLEAFNALVAYCASHSTPCSQAMEQLIGRLVAGEFVLAPALPSSELGAATRARRGGTAAVRYRARQARKAAGLVLAPRNSDVNRCKLCRKVGHNKSTCPTVPVVVVPPPKPRDVASCAVCSEWGQVQRKPDPCDPTGPVLALCHDCATPLEQDEEDRVHKVKRNGRRGKWVRRVQVDVEVSP